MKKEIKFYNVLFPIWFLLVFPVTWLIVLPVNFIIDSLVIFIGLKALKIDNIKSHYLKSILKVWGFGFLSDFIGAVWLFLSLLINNDWWYENIQGPVSMNPFDSLYGLIYTLIGILISGFFIYFFNNRYSFKNIDIDSSHKKKLSVYLAIFTSPYVFLIPTEILYKAIG